MIEKERTLLKKDLAFTTTKGDWMDYAADTD